MPQALPNLIGPSCKTTVTCAARELPHSHMHGSCRVDSAVPAHTQQHCLQRVSAAAVSFVSCSIYMFVVGLTALVWGPASDK
jgi:hypothetical protein